MEFRKVVVYIGLKSKYMKEEKRLLMEKHNCSSVLNSPKGLTFKEIADIRTEAIENVNNSNDTSKLEERVLYI